MRIAFEIYSRLDKDRIGAIAEYALVRESAAAKKPARLDYVQAASLPLLGLTAWPALIDLAQLQAGQTILIHAGSGGVGTFAIQLAKYLGAQVATTASAKSRALLKLLGADLVIDYKTTRFEEVAKDQKDRRAGGPWRHQTDSGPQLSAGSRGRGRFLRGIGPRRRKSGHSRRGVAVSAAARRHTPRRLKALASGESGSRSGHLSHLDVDHHLNCKESRMGTRTALVTGVSSGIGQATARALVERGWRVFGTARSKSTALPEHVERGVLDVRDPASIDAGVREVLEKAGRID